MEPMLPEQRPEDIAAEFEPVIVCGLANIGNTCYFNSGLQCLVNTPQFVTALRFCGHRNGRDRERHTALCRSTTARRTLIAAANQVIDAMDYGEEPRISPVGLVKALARLHGQFEGFGQQDCPEMVHALLQSIDDETSLAMDTKAIVSSGMQAPQCPHAAHELQCFRFMDALNDENERKEALTRQRAGKPVDPAAFRPPHLTRSAVSDVFQGYALSEVTCNACKAVSRVVEPFTTLTVEIPTAKQRRAHHALHPPSEATRARQEQERRAAEARRGWNPITALCRCVAAFFSLLCCCCGCGSPPDLGPLSLKECLDMHFSSEVLRGSNQYRCECCGAKGDATKRMSLLRAPEVLVVHLKRFEYGTYWNSKKHDHVEFPLHFDPMSAEELGALRRDSGESDGSLPHRTVLDVAAYASAANDRGGDVTPVTKELPRPSRGTTTYSLSAVVNHHGTFGGGHYTAFTCKGKHGWVLNNDGAISRVQPSEVADSQGYLLFYQKAPLLRPEPRTLELRDRARAYLLRTVPLPEHVGTARELSEELAADICYLSRAWLHRCATYAEPGLLLNRMCYCLPEKANVCLGPDGVDEKTLPPEGGARHFHCPAEWFYAPVLRRDFDAFVAHYGGGPLVSHSDFAAQLRREQLWLTALLERPVLSPA